MGKGIEEVRIFEIRMEKKGTADDGGDEMEFVGMFPAAEGHEFGNDSKKAFKWIAAQTDPATYAVLRLVGVREVKEVPKPVMEVHEVSGSAYKQLLG